MGKVTQMQDINVSAQSEMPTVGRKILNFPEPKKATLSHSRSLRAWAHDAGKQLLTHWSAELLEVTLT